MKYYSVYREIGFISDGASDVYAGEKIKETDVEISESDFLCIKRGEQQRVLFSASTRLNETDWYAVRFAETGIPIPEEIKTERQALRKQISALREHTQNALTI